MDKAKPKQPPEFGQRLKQVREKDGRSLRDVESKSGLNSGYLSQLENGKIAHPSPSVLQRVADGYGLRFEDLLQWTGYVTQPEQDVSANQAVAFSTVSSLGDPSDEELDTLRAIVKLLHSKRSLPYTPPSDLPLDEPASEAIRGYALAVLREAGALGARPTPLGDLQSAAQLVITGELTLDAADRAQLVERFGHWVGRAWKRLQGALDFRSSAIWVAPDLHEMKRRFVIAHEIGHAILPAHAQTFAYVDDPTRLPPFARDLFEREANQAAVELLLQGGEGTEEFDSSPPSLEEICRISAAFGASIVATARYVAETSRRAIAVAIAHHGASGSLGPTHLYASASFQAAYGWQASAAAPPQLRAALRTAASRANETWVAENRRREPGVVNVETMDTGYAALCLVVPESRVRNVARKLVRPVQAVAAGSPAIFAARSR